jgi:hypothetical protein
MTTAYNHNTFQYHQKRREVLRAVKGDFQPNTIDLEHAKRQYFAQGGVVTRLKVTRETIPAVWGDFVKSKATA